MPSPTPRPTLMVPALESALVPGAGAAVVLGLVWTDVLELELTSVLVVPVVEDNADAVDELVRDELEARFVMLK